MVLAARRVDRIEAEAARLGRGATAVPLDVADEASVIAAFDVVGACDVVVNNAGTALTGLALGTSAADWDRVVDVNLRGAFLVAREAARRLVAAGRGGSIVNVGSARSWVNGRPPGLPPTPRARPAFCTSRARWRWNGHVTGFA